MSYPCTDIIFLWAIPSKDVILVSKCGKLWDLPKFGDVISSVNCEFPSLVTWTWLQKPAGSIWEVSHHGKEEGHMWVELQVLLCFSLRFQELLDSLSLLWNHLNPFLSVPYVPSTRYSFNQFFLMRWPIGSLIKGLSYGWTAGSLAGTSTHSYADARIAGESKPGEAAAKPAAKVTCGAQSWRLCKAQHTWFILIWL